MTQFKKSHVAIGIALALPFVAMAQSTVSIGGIIDGGVRYDSGGVGGSLKSVNSGMNNPDRITFSGYEDLGSGLKGGFVLETGFTVDNGSGASNPPGTAAGPLTFGRTSDVVLGSDQYGYISLGRQYTPLWPIAASPAADPFGGSWMGGNGTVMSTTSRASNSITYSYGYGYQTMLRPAPKTGLTVALMYAPGEVAGFGSAGKSMGASTSYGNGVWWIGYGYHRLLGNSPSIVPTAASSGTPILQQHVLTASYQIIDAVRVHVGLNKGSNDAVGAGALDRRAWTVGTTITFGTNFILASYGRANDKTAVNGDYSSFQLGYQYNLSRRTSLYAGYGNVSNSNATAVILSGAGGTYALGSHPKSVIAGVKHLF